MKRAQSPLDCWSALEKFPPYYVRMLAKHKAATALSDAEIAISSGIPLNRIREIKLMSNWLTLTVAEVLAFTTACNFDPTSGSDRRRIDDYEAKCKKRKKVPFQYLRKSPKWESEILPLLKMLQSRQQSSAA